VGKPRWDCLPSESSSSEDLDSKPSSASGKFAFVHHTGPTIEDRNTRRLIKKHVMIDIGECFFGGLCAPSLPQASNSCGTLELSSGLKLTREIAGKSRRNKPIRKKQKEPQEPESQSSFCISHFGTTRDPFMAYPIKMDRRTLELVDHCQYHPLSHLSVISIIDSRKYATKSSLR
jgi:hypothetical protein